MNIDLGVDMSKHMEGPPGAIAGPMEGGKQYPHFHYCGPKELHLPDSGEMTVTFKKKSETSSIKDDGSHWYECCIEVREITEVESDEPKSPTSGDHSAEEALDTLAEELRKHREMQGEEGEDEDEYE